MMGQLPASCPTEGCYFTGSLDSLYIHIASCDIPAPINLAPINYDDEVIIIDGEEEGVLLGGGMGGGAGGGGQGEGGGSGRRSRKRRRLAALLAAQHPHLVQG